MNKYAKSIGFCRRFFQTSICDLKGHSKWQNIKHIKAANDLQRNLLISKQVKMIRLAIQGLSKYILVNKNALLLMK